MADANPDFKPSRIAADDLEGDDGAGSFLLEGDVFVVVDDVDIDDQNRLEEAPPEGMEGSCLATTLYD